MGIITPPFYLPPSFAKAVEIGPSQPQPDVVQHGGGKHASQVSLNLTRDSNGNSAENVTPDGTHFRCADDVVMGGEAGMGQENAREGLAAGMMDVGRGGVWSTSAGRWYSWRMLLVEWRMRSRIQSNHFHGVL